MITSEHDSHRPMGRNDIHSPIGMGPRGHKGDKGDKGDTGNTGATGAAAGFGAITASIDDGIGTPSVDITASGPNTAKSIAIAFHNLKGEPGETFTFDDLTPAQLDELRADISNVYVYFRVDERSTIPTVPNGGSVSTLAIPWSDFDAELDMLFVDIEGLTLTRGIDFIIPNNGFITLLSNPITHSGTHVNFKRVVALAADPENLNEMLTDRFLSVIAPVEGDNASTSYAVDSYLIHDGSLCKVTSAITAGDTIAIGTNVSVTTVMAELVELTS